MSGTMARVDLVDDLKASLHDATGIFTAPADGDFARLLDIACADLGRYRPLVKSGSLTLVAGTAAYAAPADLIAWSRETWSPGLMPPPWDASYPGPLPRIEIIGAAGARQILFAPAPTAALLGLLGSAFSYLYHALHAIGNSDAETTLAAADRGLLLLRAQAEAMREMAIRNAGKPVQLRDGLSGAPRNGTPGYLYDALLREFKDAA